MIIVMVMVIILIIYTAYFPYRYDQMRFTLDELRERNIKIPLTLPYLLWQRSFWPWIFPSDDLPIQSSEVGPNFFTVKRYNRQTKNPGPKAFSPKYSGQQRKFTYVKKIVGIRSPRKKNWCDHVRAVFR